MSCKEDDAPGEAQRAADAAAVRQDVCFVQPQPAPAQEAPAAGGGPGLFFFFRTHCE